MSTKILVLCSLALGLAVGLAGCDRGDQAAPSNTADQTAGAAARPLKITSWGPDRTKAGVAFNAQPDGSAALWTRLNRPLSSGAVTVDFNGHPLPAAVQGDLVTASVPQPLYAVAGTYALHVTVKQGAVTVHSNDVKFLVE
jgi:hypothetical protein